MSAERGSKSSVKTFSRAGGKKVTPELRSPDLRREYPWRSLGGRKDGSESFREREDLLAREEGRGACGNVFWEKKSLFDLLKEGR